MIYRMNKKLYLELGGFISRKGHIANKAAVIKRINQSFGLRGEVRDIVLV